MTTMTVSARLLAGILLITLFASMAKTAEPVQGDTSGPAVGTSVKPSAATQKQVTSPSSSTAAGAPGATGRQGSESGEKPNRPSRSESTQSK
jgi:hypothetical protein